jgi:hypothetical protein
VTARSRDLPVGGAPLAADGEHDRSARTRRLGWLRVLPPLAGHIGRTMPWVTLSAGCLTGVTCLAILAYVADTAHWSLTQGGVRFAFVPAVAGLAFIVRAPFRPLTHTTPVPAWVGPAGYLLLAAPVLAVTCWAELRIALHTMPPHAAAAHAAVYPLIAQLTGWCAVTVAAAAAADRSRYADLGGVIAAPVSFAAIALVWFLPATARYLVEPSATGHDVTIAWYSVASAALALTCVTMRDHWHRYGRNVHWPPARDRGR